MIQVTDAASKKIRHQLERRGKGIGIKIGVRTTGCSGLAYVLEYVDDPWVGSTAYPQTGYAVIVDNKDIPYLQGMIVDYVRNGLNEGFEFRNPNERDRCGCGESFRI